MLQSEPSLVGGSAAALAPESETPPFAPVLELEAKQPGRFAVAALVAAFLHVALESRVLLGLSDMGDYARGVQHALQHRIQQSIDVNIAPQREPDPEPETEPEPQPEPEPVVAPPPKAPP